MKHFQSKVLTAAILAALSGSAIAATEVYEKSEVDTKIDAAKTEVTNALTSKIDTAKNELETKLTAQNESGKEDIKKIKAAVVKITKSLMGEEGNDENPGVFGALQDLNTSVESNKSKIEELTTNLADTNAALAETDAALDATTKALNEATDQFNTFATSTVENIKEIDKKLDNVSNAVSDHADKFNDIADSLDEVNTKADEAVNTANEAKQLAEETKQNVDTKVKAAEDAAISAKADADKAGAAAGEAKSAAGEAKAAAAKVTDVEKVAKAALVQAYNNTQDINGFEVGDTLYDIENDKIKPHKATQEDVDNDTFKGKGLKKVVAEKADKAELDKVSGKVTANETAIATKADKAELDKVSGKVTANETAIATKADKANVYTKQESDSRFVKVENSIGGLNTTANELKTRLASAEKSVADLRKETRQGLAEQAALSGLFQPYNVGRFNVTAAVGGYKSESAIAIGTGFRFTENFAAKAGVAVGTSSGSSAAYHVGVNYEW